MKISKKTINAIADLILRNKRRKPSKRKILVVFIILILNLVYWLNAKYSDHDVVLKAPDQKPVAVQHKTEKVSITFIPDGDTVHLKDGRKVRIYGIDAPEVYPKESLPSKIGTASRDYLTQLLKNKKVELKINQNTPFDQYNRVLGDLLIDGESVAELMVQNGYAYTYFGAESETVDKFKKIENEARKNQKGIWKESLDKSFFERFSKKIQEQNESESQNSEVALIGQITKTKHNVHVLRFFIKTESEEIALVIKFDHWHHFDENFLKEELVENKKIWAIGRLQKYRNKPELHVRYPHQIYIE